MAWAVGNDVTLDKSLPFPMLQFLASEMKELYRDPCWSLFQL